MFRSISLAAVAAFLAAPVYAQDTSGAIDEIFSWAGPTTPGCAVAVSEGGQRVVNRAYGSADLERGTPITTSTIFDVGSVQKQFTAASILLLVDEGHLSLTDDVRIHIPELPDYGHTITLDHLLTHTSGIRDWPGMLSMAADDPHVMTYILRQRDLNFAPGEEWSYSTSGYELLKEVVARTSGMSFSDFTRTRLFEPLGMTRTQYRQDVHADIENLALAYDRDADGWKVDMMLGNDRGGGALLSTAADLLTWHEALTGGRLGAFVTESIQEPATLKNGRTLNYARALFVDADRDGKRVWHTGGAAGYSTFLGGYPDRGLSMATTCNLDGGSSRVAPPVVKLFLPPRPDESVAETGTTAAAEGAPGATAEDVDLTGRAGLFFHEDTGQPLRLVVNDGRLGIAGGGPLETIANDRFRNPRGRLQLMSQDEFELRFLSQDELALTSMEGETTRYQRARGWSPSPGELSAFTGRYESDELGAVWRIEAAEGGLTARFEHAPDRAVEFTPVEPDAFMMSRMMIRFQRDEAGRVVGFDYSNPLIRDLRFTRLSNPAG